MRCLLSTFIASEFREFVSRDTLLRVLGDEGENENI